MTVDLFNTATRGPVEANVIPAKRAGTEEDMVRFYTCC